jgi:hypothetical protein
VQTPQVITSLLAISSQARYGRWNTNPALCSPAHCLPCATLGSYLLPAGPSLSPQKLDFEPNTFKVKMEDILWVYTQVHTHAHMHSGSADYFMELALAGHKCQAVRWQNWQVMSQYERIHEQVVECWCVCAEHFRVGIRTWTRVVLYRSPRSKHIEKLVFGFCYFSLPCGIIPSLLDICTCYVLFISVCVCWHRSRVRFPALPDFMHSSGSGMGSAQPLWG